MQDTPTPPEPADPVVEARSAERRLAIGYAPAERRAALAALFALDERLGAILRTTREPMVGQMRLTWWHDALSRLDRAPVPAEPVLAALAATVLPLGIAGAQLAAPIDGWEMLLDGPIRDAGRLAEHARARGGALFTLAARVLAAQGDPVAAAGEGWALADLALHLSDADAAARAAALAEERLAPVLSARWSRAGRPLGAIAWAARMDVAAAPRPAAHPLRIARLLRHRLTGR